MLQFLILAVVAALASADYPGNIHPTECGPLQKLKFKTQWHQVFSEGEEREIMDHDVYKEMFRLHPEWIEQYFERVHGWDVNSPEFRAHMARVMDAFDLLVTLLTEQELLEVQLEHFGHKHTEIGIPEEHFEVFRKSVIHVAEEKIGHCFNWDAWEHCSKVITEGIQVVLHADAAAAAAAA